jgi:hypothetical protein
MDKGLVFRRIVLGPEHQPTGAVRHIVGGEEAPRPYELRIERYSWDDREYYLVHYDESGDEITDTHHDSLEQALAQAELEFNIKPDSWEVLI